VPCQVALGFPDPSNPLRVYVPGVNHKSFNNFSPKLGVQLHPTDDIMVYGSWSKGYKTGGWTTRLSNPLPTAPDFNEEKAESWELGVKSEFLQRRLQVNAAAFTTDYTGIQLNFQEGVSPTIRNAGDARIKGGEVEVVAAPARGFTINASLGYIDAKYTSVLPGVLAVSGPNAFQAGTFDGADLPKTPKWKLNVSPRYQADLPNGATLVVLGDWTHASSAWNDSQRSYLLKRKASDMVGASATYHSADGRWELTVGGTNLLNDRYLTTGGTNIAAGVVFGTYNRPREWYSRLAVKF
jgi:outer membrane receptor protein involved in Fe transport